MRYLRRVTPKPSHLDGYVRVSRVGARDVDSASYQTEDVQREAIERWAEARGIVIAEWHLDRDQSGGKADRPGFAAAMARVRSGDTGGIVVATLDRFSRQSTIDALKRVAEIQDAGGQVASVGGEVPVDPTTGEGEFILTLFLALARMEWRRYAARWETAKARALGRGAKISPTPFGYMRGDGGTLVVDPTSGPVVTEAYVIAARDGVDHAAAYLREQVPDRTWTPYTTRRVLANRSYLGESWYGDDVHPDAHAPLTDRATFTAAQSVGKARGPAADYPLSGVAQCAGCGGAMIGATAGAGTRTYRCYPRKGAAACPAPAIIVADRLEGHVRGAVAAALAGRAVEQGEDFQSDMRAAERALDQAEAELATFAADVDARRVLGDAGWKAALEARAAARDEAEAAYAEAVDRDRPRRVIPSGDVVATLPWDDLRDVLRDVVEAIQVTRGRGGDLNERVRFIYEPEGDAGVSAA